MSLLIKVILSLAALILGAIGIFGKTFENNKITKNGIWVLFILFIIFIASIGQEFYEDREERNNKIKEELTKINQLKQDTLRNQEQLIRYKNEIDKLESIINNAKLQNELSISLNKKTDKIDELQKKLQTKTDTLSSLSKNIYDSGNGTDSFCYISLFRVSSKRASVHLRREGRYPIRDIRISLINPVKQWQGIPLNKNNLTEADWAKLDSVIQRYNVSVLPPNNQVSLNLGTIPFSLPGDSVLQFNYVSTSSYWTQHLTTRVNNNKITQTSKIIKRIVENGISKGVLIKEIHDEF